MDGLNELFDICDDEKPRIRLAYEKIVPKYSNNEVQKLDEHSAQEAFFITYYIGQGLTWINDDLRNGLKLTKCKELFIDYLDKALEKVKSYSGTVYRMDGPDADTKFELDWFKKNTTKTIYCPGYLSTSIEHWDNRPVTWQIETLKTESFGKDLSSLNKVEMEILFKRGSKFRIIDVHHDSSTVVMQEVDINSKVDIDLIRDYTGFRNQV